MIDKEIRGKLLDVYPESTEDQIEQMSDYIWGLLDEAWEWGVEEFRQNIKDMHRERFL